MDNLYIKYLPDSESRNQHYWVYVHTSPNMKYYVGITHSDNLQSRWGKDGSKYKNNNYFYSAIQKYGWNNFIHEAWEVESQVQMYEMEIWLIDFFESNNREHGYNHSIGGEHSGEMGKNSQSKEYKYQYNQREDVKEKEHIRFQTDEYKEYMQQYRIDHKDELKEKRRLYNQREDVIERRHQYCQKEEVKMYRQNYQRQYRQNEEVKAKRREYEKQYRLKKRNNQS